jgi:hypothetical protein
MPFLNLISRLLHQLFYSWAFIPFIGDLFAGMALTAPPVLIVSFPRSGSSWLGSMLGLSSNAAYLREPINTSFLSSGGQYTLKMICASRPDPLFAKCSAKAFLKAPRYDTNIVAYPKQWLPWKVIGRRLLLKEVNPLALEYWIKAYSPLIVFIIRHPAAIAASYAELGWLENSDILDTPSEHCLSTYEIFGRRVGEVYQQAFAILDTYPSHLVVKYEDLVYNKFTELQKISQFTRLVLSKSLFSPQLSDRKPAASAKQTPFSLNNRGVDQITKWHRVLTSSQVDDIQRGYMHSRYKATPPERLAN